MSKTREELGKNFETEFNRANSGFDKVKLRQKGNRLYLRATLPPKAGNGKWKQQDIAIGAKCDLNGLKKAKSKAQKLDSDLFKESFDWFDWLKDKPNKKTPETIGDWLDRFIENYWHCRERTSSREKNFKYDYLYYFHHLPSSQPISMELLRETAIAYSDPETRKRQKFCKAFGALARFAGVEGKISDLARGYKAKKRTLPEDTEVYEKYQDIPHDFWRWAYGLIVCFGIRPHEVFNVDIVGLNGGVPILQVFEQTKTGAREVMPMPGKICGAWVQEWELWKRPRSPLRKLDQGNEALGNLVTKAFKRYDIGFTPYYLRDLWAIRCLLAGVESSIVSRQMGHSLTTFYNHYQRHIDARHFKQIYQQTLD